VSRSQRDKGKRGEREAAKAIRQALGVSARRAQQFSGDGSADLVVDADGIHWEVKYVERESVRSWMRQAERDAGGNVPVVLHRKSREPWLLTVPLERAYELFVRLEEARSPSLQAVGGDDVPCPVPPEVLREAPGEAASDARVLRFPGGPGSDSDR
jgi:Holliday junction resolvase